MLTLTDRAADSRLRRSARQAGYCLHKSRMNLGMDNHGGYRIVDPDMNWVMAGEKYDLDSQDVIDWLATHQQGRLARST